MKEKIKTLVYVAGPLSDDECGYLQNVSKNIKTAVLIKNRGYSVVAPSVDLLLGIQSGIYEYYDYADNSLEIMKRCDVLYLDEDWNMSNGCKREARVARELGIPIVFSLKQLENLDTETIKHFRVQNVDSK